MQLIQRVGEGCSRAVLGNGFNRAGWFFSEPVCQDDKLLTSIFRWSGSQWKFRATGVWPIDGWGRIWSMGSPSMINLSGRVLWSAHAPHLMYISVGLSGQRHWLNVCLSPCVCMLMHVTHSHTVLSFWLKASGSWSESHLSKIENIFNSGDLHPPLPPSLCSGREAVSLDTPTPTGSYCLDKYFFWRYCMSSHGLCQQELYLFILNKWIHHLFAIFHHVVVNRNQAPLIFDE